MTSLRDDIVITGISGRFPESTNIDKFKENLFQGVDMVTDDDRRWPRGVLDMPTRSGKLGDLTSFDASFFGVHAKQAQTMDPQLRILLELTQEAIIDAGINPAEIRGSNTGVFIGASYSESLEYWTSDPDRVNGYEVLGGSRAMLANRISYTFDFVGPSYVIDTACSSSLLAMHQACVAIKSGDCESAIVGGVSINLKPTTTLQFHRLQMLSSNGKCKSFDASADGYVRAEAAAVVFLQKSRDSKRIYASVVNSKTNTDGYKSRGVTFPSRIKQNELLQQIYNESRIDPREVAYVEAHGTGTKAGDSEEVNAIAQHFCKDRSSPLLIGSVKSNMGHSEPASGICSVVKVLITMESGRIPANLHYKEPNPDILALIDGRIKVVHKPTSYDGGLIGVNSFGFGGTNVHVILKSSSKNKPLNTSAPFIPKIVGVSGRNKEGCEVFLNKIKDHKKNDEFVGLVHQIHANNIVGHNHRGFAIVQSGNESFMEIDEYQDTQTKRPIWYVFSGMGTQWPGMGKSLMVFQAFARSIYRSADALKTEQFNLIDLIENNTRETFENVVNSFVLIVSIQIALVDLLTSIGIKPDGIVGHSAGELACAYADGALTHEQTVLSAYWRGKSLIDGNVSGGALAAVGLSWQETARLCPPGVEIACHTSLDSTTVAGPAKLIDTFVEKLTKKGIFAKALITCGFAFHSSYIKSAGGILRSALQKIIHNPQERSSKWLSSSVPEASWGTRANKYADADYFVNNLLFKVHFLETLKYIPDNAITIEIAPHCALRTVLKRSLPSKITNLALLIREHSNNVEFFLTNLGRLYNAGGQPDFSKLYPSIDFPVSRGTPMLNSMVIWDHSQQWAVVDFSKPINTSEEIIFEIDLTKEEHAYLSGHALDGRIIFPASGYLDLVWKVFAKLNATVAEKIPIVFKDVKLHRATILPNEGKVRLIIQILRGSGDFEICESGAVVVTGQVLYSTMESLNKELLIQEKQKADIFDLNKDDIYKELRLRGYDYSGIFKSIASSDNIGSRGEIIWNGQWIPFVDAMLHFNVFRKHKTDLYLPTRLHYISIDPIKHSAMINNKKLEVYSDLNLNIVKSGGIEIRGIKWSLAPRRPLNKIQSSPRLEKYVFVPYDNPEALDSNPKTSEYHALTVLCQIVIENLGMFKIKGLEACSHETESLISPIIADILTNESTVTYDLKVASLASLETHMPMLEKFKVTILKKDISSAPIGQDLHFVIATDVLSKEKSKVLSNLAASVTSNGYLLLIENGRINETLLKESELMVVAKQISYDKSYHLLTKKSADTHEPVIIKLTGKDFSWLKNVKKAIKKSQNDGQQTLLVSQGEELFGIVGLMNCLRRETGGQHFRYVYIPDSKGPKFSLKDPIFFSQLQKRLVANVFINQQWGSYRHLSFGNENEVKTVQSQHSYINTLVRGDLSSLRWIESPLTYYDPKICSSHELCTVYYAPLNFRDVMLASGKLPPDALPLNLVGQDCVLGLEFAGRDSEGNRVMGMVPARCLATSVFADKSGFLWKIPDNWSMEEAATIPVCYATSYYALFVRGKIRSGESVLIHSESGGVGLASIALALDAGCEVFTTVGTPEKREFLKKMFPRLADRNISNSRNTTFEQLILDETNGRGVDLVLNSQAGDNLQASVRCLASNGRFIEIGKYDLSNNSPLGMEIFLKNTSFYGILLDALFESDSEDRKLVHNLVSEGIKNGSVKPLPTTVFNEHEIEQGFRFMASGKHIGKVLLKIRDEEKKTIVTPIPKTVASISRTYLNPEKSYIIVGGLGGFGLEMANWMISRGAKYIVLTSRSGIRTGYQALCIHRWRDMGVTVVISKENVFTIESANNLLFDSNKIAPVGGIFNLAAVLHNDIIENLNETHFRDVTMCKINATKCLDLTSRELCPSLEYFVVFSSLSCGRGMPGQTNYGLANSTMERIVEKRKSMGLPGLAIQWGAIGDVGLVMDTVGDNNTDVGGTLPQRICSCLDVLDKFLKLPNDYGGCVSSMVVNDKNGSNKDITSQVDLFKFVSNLLGIKDINKVNRSTTFSDLGLDSLMTTEIKQTLERDYDIVLSDEEIRQMTFAKIDLLSANDLPFRIVQLPHSELVHRDPLIHVDNSISSGDPIFFIQILNMKNLAMILNRPTYALQITQDVPITSIPDCAKFFINLMKSIQPKGPYTIIGYCFGTCVAVEIALQLESEGDAVTLNLLDGSPEFILNGIKAFSKRLDPNSDYIVDFQRKIMCYYTKRVNVSVDIIQLYPILRSIENHDEMMNKFVEIVGTTTLTPEELKAEAILCMKKLMAAWTYKPAGKLSGPVILFKASQRSDINEDDYGLSKICRQENLKIKEIEGDHHSITTTDSYSKIVGNFIV